MLTLSPLLSASLAAASTTSACGPAVAPTVISFFSCTEAAAEEAGFALEPQPVMMAAAERAQSPAMTSFFNRVSLT